MKRSVPSSRSDGSSRSQRPLARKKSYMPPPSEYSTTTHSSKQSGRLYFDPADTDQQDFHSTYHSELDSIPTYQLFTEINEFEGLQPTFSAKHDLRASFKHFKTNDPKINSSACDFANRISNWYQTQYGHRCCNVWSTFDAGDAQRIADQYQRMLQRNENYKKFAYRSTTYFIKEDDLPDSTTDVERSFGPTLSHLIVEWNPSPDEVTHHVPVQLREHVQVYMLTSYQRPHFMYCPVSSSSAFDPEAEMATQYLTVQFGEDGDQPYIATKVISTAAEMVLCNRFWLRRKRLESKSPRTSWTNRDLDDLKHYGLAFSGSSVRLYVVKLMLDLQIISCQEVWPGCKTELLKEINLTSAEAVLDLQSWINEIHNWGLGPHYKAVLKDLWFMQNSIFTRSQEMIVDPFDNHVQGHVGDPYEEAFNTMLSEQELQDYLISEAFDLPSDLTGIFSIGNETDPKATSNNTTTEQISF